MYAISSSFGNDSCALIQWAHDSGLDLVADVYVVFIDTGWAGEGWLERVAAMEKWVATLGFRPVRLKATTDFEDLMVQKKGFPNQRYQWCSTALKTIPFLHWIDKTDPDGKWTIVIGKRREESTDRVDTPEFEYESPYHGNRAVWCPLVEHTHTNIGTPCSPVPASRHYPTVVRNARHASMPIAPTSSFSPKAKLSASRNLKAKSGKQCSGPSDTRHETTQTAATVSARLSSGRVKNPSVLTRTKDLVNAQPGTAGYERRLPSRPCDARRNRNYGAWFAVRASHIRSHTGS